MKLREYLTFAVLMLVLSACAVCDTHPVACKVALGVAVVVVAGEAAAYGVKHAHMSSNSSNTNSAPPAPPPPVNPCAGNPACAT
jgi:hypothetical protein